MTDLTSSRLAEIKAAAEKATPGEWCNCDLVDERAPEGCGPLVLGGGGMIAECAEKEDATHITNCKPSNIVAMVDRIRELEAANDTAIRELGEWGRKAGALEAKIERLRDELRSLYKAYVGMLEIGRDRILFLGGDCDPVDMMEVGDPALRRARAALEDK